MSVPTLSIGMPVWNGMPYVQEALDNIARNEFQDYELIVCDNASTDRTGELVRDLASGDPRIRYVRNERNLGASGNHNKAFALARGRYFRWAASDDLISPGAIARCVEALDAEQRFVLALPHTRLIDSNSNVTGDYDDGDGWSAPTASERFGFSIGRWGLSNTMYGVVRREVLARTDLQGDYPASDLIMQSDLAIQGPFIRIAGEYYYRRMHDRCTDALDEVALAKFYDPDRDVAFGGKVSRMFRELVRVVRRAPVEGSEKRRLWAHLLRGMVWQRETLARELLAKLSGKGASKSSA